MFLLEHSGEEPDFQTEWSFPVFEDSRSVASQRSSDPKKNTNSHKLHVSRWHVSHRNQKMIQHYAMAVSSSPRIINGEKVLKRA